MSRWQQLSITTAAVAGLLFPLSAEASIFGTEIGVPKCPRSEIALFDGTKWFCKGEPPLPFRLPEPTLHELCMPDGNCIKY